MKCQKQQTSKGHGPGNPRVADLQGVFIQVSRTTRFCELQGTLIELKERGKITLSGPFTIKSVVGDDSSKTYELELSDGENWTVSIQNNLLTVGGFPVTSIYKRIR